MWLMTKLGCWRVSESPDDPGVMRWECMRREHANELVVFAEEHGASAAVEGPRYSMPPYCVELARHDSIALAAHLMSDVDSADLPAAVTEQWGADSQYVEHVQRVHEAELLLADIEADAHAFFCGRGIKA